MEFAILRATPQDSEALTDIAIAAKRYWNYPEKWIQLWIPSLTISADYISKYETWMGVVNNLFAAFYSLKEDDKTLWLDNFWVLPPYIGQGIGRQLFLHAVERCQLRESKILRIEADPNAQLFYEKMGARKVGEHRGEVDGQARILPVMKIVL